MKQRLKLFKVNQQKLNSIIAKYILKAYKI